MELTPAMIFALVLVLILLPFFIRDVVFRVRNGYWRDQRDDGSGE